jgi:hypothetical protein
MLVQFILSLDIHSAATLSLATICQNGDSISNSLNDISNEVSKCHAYITLIGHRDDYLLQGV